jgi:hypothetical protein
LLKTGKNGAVGIAQPQSICLARMRQWVETTTSKQQIKQETKEEIMMVNVLYYCERHPLHFHLRYFFSIPTNPWILAVCLTKSIHS